MQVNLLYATPNPETLIERCARCCYRSESKTTPTSAIPLIRGLLASGHESVIEHCRFVFELEATEGRILDLLLASPHLKATPRPHPLGRYKWLVSGNARALLDAQDAIPDWVMEELGDVSPVLFADPTVTPYKVQPHTTIDQTSNVELWALHIPDGLSREELLAHGAATVYLHGVSRALTHQLVRHRMASYCLSGDTIVPSFIKRKGLSPKRWTMKQLYEWSQDWQRKGRLKRIRLRGVNEKGELISVGIDSVIYSGKQQLYKVTTESGRTIRATEKHQFLTENGWKTLKDLEIGERLKANGLPAYQNKDYLYQRYIVENVQRKDLANEIGVSDACLGKWIAKLGLQKPKSMYANRRGPHISRPCPEHVKEKLRSIKGEDHHGWKGNDITPNAGRQRANKIFSAEVCERCGSFENIERHHKDRNPLNNIRGNMAFLCPKCHRAEHIGQMVMTVFNDKIVSITLDAIEDTYDLSIADPCHNFVADGLVVHNSQASQRYCGEDGFEYVTPPSIENPANGIADFPYYTDMALIRHSYKRLIDMGIPKEDARYILPNAACTEIAVTMTLEGWQHFLELRCDPKAQWEIRNCSNQIKELLVKHIPEVFNE